MILIDYISCLEPTVQLYLMISYFVVSEFQEPTTAIHKKVLRSLKVVCG